MIFLNVIIPAAIRPFLLIVPAVIAGFGIHNLYVYFTNSGPTEVSIEQLIVNPPHAKWVRVTGGGINLLDGVLETGISKTLDKVYVPIYPDGKEEGVVSVLLLSTDPELLALSRRFLGLDATENSLVETFALAMDNHRKAYQSRPFEGLIQSGLARDDQVTFQLRKSIPNLAKEPIIIEEGKKPTIYGGLGLLLFAGVTMIGVLSVPKHKMATPPPLPPTPPPLPRNF